MGFPSFQGILSGLRKLDTLSVTSLKVKRRMEVTIEWIKRAYEAAGDGGISKGYSLLRGRWAPSYPETTAYTIPTLLNAAEFLDCADLQVIAVSLADYLLSSTTPEGGMAHFKARSRSKPVVFDTGQAIFGWLSAYLATGDRRYLDAAVRAGDWLVSIQAPSGSWKQNQHLGVEKVIDTRVAWALLELHQHTHQDAYYESAVHNLEWALQQQDDEGWFQRCALVEGEDPLTHTLAYTAEGLFECGRLLHEPRYMAAAQWTADALLANLRVDGSLAATYTSAWRETSRSSCLTGNGQMAHLWLRFYEMSGDMAYYEAAEKAIIFVARTQNLLTTDINLRGAIAGSYPIYGRYERFKYPNWAAKFFIDALLALDKARGREQSFTYVG